MSANTYPSTPSDNLANPTFEASWFWRLLPAGMRRRWWLFRVFDLIARYWPVSGVRKGLLIIRMDGIGDMVLFRNFLDQYSGVFNVPKNEIQVLGCTSWEDVSDEIFAGYRVFSIDEHAYAKRFFYRIWVNFNVRRFNAAIPVSFLLKFTKQVE